MQWIILILAGLFETFWAICLKYSQGFTKPIPSVLTIVGMIVSFYLLSLSLKELPLGTAYAIWTGIGTVGTLIFGVIVFHEAISIPQILCVGLIVLGIIGLKLL
ncbi:MAG: sugE [Firmicutes bacterium]|nr:sugE [Bacillota bacterium]